MTTKTDKTEKKPTKKDPAEEHSGKGHEQIDTDEFDDEFSKNYWKYFTKPPQKKD